MQKMNCRLGLLKYFYQLKIKFSVCGCHLYSNSNGFETVSKQFEKQLPFFLFLWQGLAKFCPCFVQWLQRFFERLFPDNISTANFRFYPQTAHWQIVLSSCFARQMYCSKVVRGLKSLLPNFLRLFSYRFGKWLCRWCCMWFLIEVFEHIFWLALRLRQLLIHHFLLLQ